MPHALQLPHEHETRVDVPGPRISRCEPRNGLRWLPRARLAAALLLTFLMTDTAHADAASERMVSRSEYFSWINNTNEGATEAQTLANLGFFRWLRDEYGMDLDIYAFDAGAIDGANFYGSMKSGRFARQFPRGFGPIAERAAETGTRLGLWGGPDGFGDTPGEAEARIDEMVSLCRDFHFELFKMDAVCGQLRPSKYEAFDRMMTECRKYAPDLILLNHRLDLGPGMRHTTTFLLGGAETYVDVFMPNEVTAPHHRATTIARELPPKLTRLTEDHGVCLSSCLDFWEDDLVLQAFNRSLVVAPQIYGNPWLLRDDEFPRLAQIFNVHRRYRDILVDGIELPAGQYGPNVVSRGDATTRLITLRNLSWEPVEHDIALDESIGLEKSGDPIEVVVLHPWRERCGSFRFGEKAAVEVLPFRSCLVLVTTKSREDVDIDGCAYEVVKDVPGKPVEVKLLGMPGTTATVRLLGGAGSFRGARIDGEANAGFAAGNEVQVAFPGVALKEPWHRRLAQMQEVDVPADSRALYEATCFAADNNALEVRSLERSGPTHIAAVQAARDAFFNQEQFKRRELWDRGLFSDENPGAFSVSLRWHDPRIKGGAFRLDLGKVQRVDTLVIEVFDEFSLSPLKSEEGVDAFVSVDLREWHPAKFLAGEKMTIDLRSAGPWRYLRFAPAPLRVASIRGFAGGKEVDRDGWHASNLFAPYRERHWRRPMIHRAQRAWSSEVEVGEISAGSYLCVAINGSHGVEGAIAAFRIDGEYVGCPDRSPSYPANTWESQVREVESNYTYYLPLTPEMAGKKIEAVVLSMNESQDDLKPDLWITNTFPPFAAKTLVLER